MDQAATPKKAPGFDNIETVAVGIRWQYSSKTLAHLDPGYF